MRLPFLCILALSIGAPAAAQESPPTNNGAQSQTEAQAPSQNAPAPESVKRVTYVPEVVKSELRKEIKEELLQEMTQNNWAAPHVYPDWLRRFSFHGDLRIRYEIDNFAHGNAVDYYPDFNAINQSKPFDILFRDPSSERWLNTYQRRSRVRLRARFDVDVDLGQGFYTELRVASGDGPTPVSTNQTIGAAGGNFSKYQIWLDRANIRYYPFKSEAGHLAFFIGRFENPFFRTDLTWDENINFDGVAAQGSVRLGQSLRPFVVGGAFPIFNTLFDLPPEQPNKFKSRDKWLYAAQAGTEWILSSRIFVRLGAGFFFFDRMKGVVSSECDTNISSISCDTDHSRPSFAQKGNTYRALRTPSIAALDAELNSGAPEYQFFGLSTGFRDLVYTARIDWLALPQLRLALDGEFVHNIAFHRWSVAPNALNNFKACGASDSECRANPPYGGGNYGYLARLTVGSPSISHRWDWAVSFSYRYLQSDAIIDAFANSEFALGGTNNKGYVATATLAFADNLWVTARWLSSDIVVGPQYSIDVLHFDLNVRY